MSKAVVVDHLELLALGVIQVLSESGIAVVGTSSRASEGIRASVEAPADLLVAGRCTDLPPERLTRESKKRSPDTKVVLLLDQAPPSEIAKLVSLGADGLLLRTATGDDLSDALYRLSEGERVVGAALAASTVGAVGPRMDVSEAEAVRRSGLSPKELEVLGELATGATYKEIAEALIVTQATVKTHLVHIYSKLEVRNRQEAISRALALGLLG